MGVTDGQPVNQAYTNPAFLDRRQDDTAIGKYTLANTDPASGASVTNLQKELNSDASFTGKALNSAYNAVPSYTNNDVGSVGDPLKTRADALTQRFNASAGHIHDGTTGNAPKIDAYNLNSVPYQARVNQGSVILAVTGTSTDVSVLMSGKTPGGSASVLGVVTDLPYNKVVLRYASGSQQGEAIEDATGNIVYGRLTYAASVWTMSYYSLIGTTETAYTFAVATDLAWYYQQIYNPMVSIPTYSEFATIPSDNTTADVITATTTLQGKVQLATAAQSIGSANSSGTANASVANADHVHQGVHSLAKSGSSQIYGDATLTASGGSSLTQLANNIDVYSPALSSSTPSAVSSTGAVGTGTTTARADHVHEGVHSVSKSGSAQLVGDITYTGSDGVTLTQTSNNIDFSAPALTSSAPSDVGSSASVGSATTSAKADHVHRGLTSLAKSGSSQIFGNATLTGSNGVTLTQVSNNIDVSAPAITSVAPSDVGASASVGTGTASAREDHVHKGLHSIAKTGSSALYGDVTLTAGSNITLTQTSNDITIASTASGGGGGGGSLIFYDTQQTNAWIADGAPAKIMNRGAMYQFDIGAYNTNQIIYCDFRIPASYVGGNPINISIPYFTAATSSAYSFTLVAGVIRPGVDQFIAPSYYDIMAISGTTSASANFLGTLSKRIDTAGKISGITLAAGYTIRIALYSDMPSYYVQSPLYMVTSAAEVTFT